MGTSYWAQFAPILSIEELAKVLPAEVGRLEAEVEDFGDWQTLAWFGEGTPAGPPDKLELYPGILAAYHELKGAFRAISGMALYVGYCNPAEVGDLNPAVTGVFFIVDGSYEKSELCKKFEERYGITIHQKAWVVKTETHPNHDRKV